MAMQDGDLSLEEALHYAESADEDFREGINQIMQTQNSPGFQVLLAYLREDAREATQALVDVDPLDSASIMRLQNTVKRYEWFMATPSVIIRAQVAKEIADEREAEVYDDS